MDEEPVVQNNDPDQHEDDWLSGSKACNRDDPECEACQ